MSTGYYHNPPRPVSGRLLCPICGAEVYSRAGVHPQCAARQSDPNQGKKKPLPLPRTAEEPAAGATACRSSRG